MRFALDTNILVYAESGTTDPRVEIARKLLVGLPRADTVLPVQVLGELYNVLVRKVGWDSDQAQATVVNWADAYPTYPTSAEVLLAAIDLAAAHHLRIWDAVIIAVATEMGCRFLISEDMQDGFAWNGVAVVNPFTSNCHRALAAFLK